MDSARFDRNERLFGKGGQAALGRTRILIAGAGGLGSHVVVQSALLGVGHITPVDNEEISTSNRNRYLGVWHDDPIPGSTKVDLACRQIGLIDPSITAEPIHADLLSSAALEALKRADYVLGCVDDDGVRFFLNEACLAYEKTLIDMASDAPEPGKFGGRIAIINGDRGCLNCLDLLDPDDVRRFLASREMRENEAAVYGVDKGALSGAGPSVVSVNGVVASLGMTAFMKLVTGIPVPYTFQTYRGDQGAVSKKMSEASENCFYCRGVRGKGDAANLDRYFVNEHDV